MRVAVQKATYSAFWNHHILKDQRAQAVDCIDSVNCSGALTDLA